MEVMDLSVERDKDQFRSETLDYIEEEGMDRRKRLGQYFTPKKIREELISKLPDSFLNQKNLEVLDPGCGTGEFLLSAKKLLNSPDLYGWDIDEKMVEISREVIPEANIEKTDTLKKDLENRFDLVVGNPPYYEFSPGEEIKEKYREVINGRLNIYGLFIYQGIKLLKSGGYLAFVNPPSMNNGAYFSKLREFIVRNSNIEYLSVLDNAELFHDAQQSTMLLVLKKGENYGDYIFKRNGVMVFSENANYLKRKFKGKLSLKEMNYEVRTGRLIWNENKDILTDESEGNVPVIWSHNITEEGLKLENHQKPQYVDIDEPSVGPAIVVNRVVGKPGSGKIRAALIPEGMEFIGENHVNVIFPPKKKQTFLSQEGEKVEEQTLDLEDILEQLNSPGRLKVVQSITGNTQLSKTELERLFPFSLDS